MQPKESASVWQFDYPEERDGTTGKWRLLHRWAGPGAIAQCKLELKSLRWRVAYGELFALTIGEKKPLPVDPRCYM